MDKIQGAIVVQFESGLEFFKYEVLKNGPFFDIRMRSLSPLTVSPMEMSEQFHRVKEKINEELVQRLREGRNGTTVAEQD